MIKLKRILFPTDFSPCAAQAFTHALYLAKQYQAELHVLHAVVLYGFYNQPELGFVSVETVQRQLAEATKRHMTTMLEPYPRDQVKIVQVQRRGNSPAPVILEYAKEQDIDLVVLGTHGRRGLGHLLLGSVAEEVVRMSSCPFSRSASARSRGSSRSSIESSYPLISQNIPNMRCGTPSRSRPPTMRGYSSYMSSKR